MFYELFLDEKGEKISKSKGNGITIDEWLRYAPQESLSLFMYLSPQKAKKLYYDIIPKNTDEYIAHLNSYHKEEDEIKKMANPLYHIHTNAVPGYTIGINYSLLINLVNACNTDNEEVVWKYISHSIPSLKMNTNDLLDRMVKCAINYYQDFVKPNLVFRAPSNDERSAITDLVNALGNMQGESAETLQNKVYEVGMNHSLDLKSWFQALYEVLLGSSQGPRFGSFIALYGVQETINLINEKLKIL